MVTLGIITPTIGRESLRAMLERLIPQLDTQDRIMVVGDGPQPNANAIVQSLNCPLIRYSEHGPLWNYGNPQRNLAIAESQTDYVMFVDDDDMPETGAIATVKAAIAEHPGRPLMFKMRHLDVVLWGAPRVEMANVSGQMFVTPNLPGRVGQWSGRYEADYDFIKSTLAHYPNADEELIWRHDLICTQGYVGRQSGAVELP